MSSPLADLYQRYKIGTKRVEQWLTNLANRQLHTRDGATSTKPISVPTAPAELNSTIIVLEDVIAGRREYGLWHRLRIRDKDEAYIRETASHEHFVDVLAEILTRLKKIQSACQRPFKSQRGKKKGGKGKKEATPNTSTVSTDDIEGTVRSCIYSDPEPEQVDSLTNKMTDATFEESAAKPQTRVKIELQRPEDEDMFALWCFLKECHTVRLYLRSIWQEYYAGELSLLVAAEVTESVFIMLSQAAWGFTLDYPQLSSFDQVADRLQIRAQIRGSDIQSFAYEGNDDAKDSMDTAQAVELLCIPAFAALQTLKEALRAFKDLEEDMQELLEVSDSYHMLNDKMMTALLKTGKNFDFFTSGFIARMHCRKTQLSIDEVIQYQLYMDILDGRKGLTNEIGTLCTLRDYVHGSTGHYEAQAPSMMEACGVTYDETPTFRHSGLQFCQDVLFKNPEDEEKKILIRGPAARNLPYIAELCANFPVLCGRASNYLLRQHHVDGVVACRQHPFVVALAHLYRASLEAGVLRRRWRDLDHVIDILGPVNLGFIGMLGSHAPVIVSARRFGMAFGIPAAEYSKEHRNRRNQKSNRLPLPQTNHVAKERDKTDLPKSPCANAMLQRHETGDLLDLLSDASIEVDQEARKQWAASKTLDITTLLGVLKKQMIEEEKLACFDLHCFSVQSGRRLWVIKNEFDGDFNLIEMVDEILWASVGAQSLDQTLLGGVAAGFEATIQKYDSNLLDSGVLLAESLKFQDEDFEDPILGDLKTSLLQGTPGVAMTGSKVKLLFQKLPADERKAAMDTLYKDPMAENEVAAE
ncbi:hypothetical protein M409DRAFT_25720 [Zasmidium cellare ATCC 36951]|uniref:DUF6604 domain-containing protein n=1 Tax=Zasmidium cellare ATCC 36951 TaxID=1080233 RepID=A0A6A6CAW9_ZASCE|nr:uncharacterized protein M409DRAFT_25720 [Zasmidium cellare ATCC 36951]KAF2163943.1 hypothetical protein M409DRAFT_25720 [Zasmidium cellare ATCC 36951]